MTGGSMLGGSLNARGGAQLMPGEFCVGNHRPLSND